MATFKRRRYSVGGKGRNSRSNSNTKRNKGSRSNSKTRKASATVQQQAQKLFPAKAVKEAQQIIREGGDENKMMKFVKKYKYRFLAAAAVILIAGGVAYRNRENLSELNILSKLNPSSVKSYFNIMFLETPEDRKRRQMLDLD